MIKLIDIHSHLQFPEFDADREDVIKEMGGEGVATITVGTDFEMSRKAVELSHTSDLLFSTIGIHPTHPEDFNSETFSSLLNEKVVAIGECGIDLYRSKENLISQRENFIRHIEFALEHNLPLMIHGRPSSGTMDAYEEILEILTAHPVHGNVHFFVGSLDIARKFLDLGFTLSFDGPITFSRDYDEMIEFVPLDMLHAETDAPFASPDPFRGRRNTPLNVRYIIEAIARIKKIEISTLEKTLIENAFRTFPRLEKALR